MTEVSRNPNPRLVRSRRRRRTTGTIEPGRDFEATWERVHARETRPMGSKPSDGPGPTSPFVRGFRAFLRDRNIRKIIDVGCGEVTWWNHVIGDAPEGRIRLIGYDVSPAKVRLNKSRYRNRPDWIFRVADGRAAQFPEADLVVCRRVINHLWFADAVALRRNIARRAHLVAITHDPTLRANPPDGMRQMFAPDCPRATTFTPMNMRRPPFMPMPVVASLEDEDDQLFSIFPGRIID